MKIYVASSWRNQYAPHVIKQLRQRGHEVYDFKEPSTGFHWSEISQDWDSWSPKELQEALSHPLARRAFDGDYGAMEWADACVVVEPCGISAHLEAGWFVGQGKPCAILLANGDPELMYKMAVMCVSIDEVEHALDDPLLDVITLHEGDEEWHDGPGWYYTIDDYPDEGSCGAFKNCSEAREHAKEAGYEN